jgi:protein-S-isoprenylcysteine O-methyltransferase Ste14
MVLGLAGLVLTGSLFSRSPFVIAVQLAAAALMLWARVTFGRRSFHAAADPTAGGLVTTGPYRYIRHPIYAAACAFGLAGAAAHASAASGGLCVLLLAGAAIRIACEERLVVETYPEYANYARRTKRVIPWIL